MRRAARPLDRGPVGAVVWVWPWVLAWARVEAAGVQAQAPPLAGAGPPLGVWPTTVQLRLERFAAGCAIGWPAPTPGKAARAPRWRSAARLAAARWAAGQTPNAVQGVGSQPNSSCGPQGAS